MRRGHPQDHGAKGASPVRNDGGSLEGVHHRISPLREGRRAGKASLAAQQCRGTGGSEDTDAERHEGPISIPRCRVGSDGTCASSSTSRRLRAPGSTPWRVTSPSCPSGCLKRHRRFATAAGAIRFIVEDLPAVRTLGAWMQVGDARYDSEAIHRLYESSDYPLRRRTCRGLLSTPSSTDQD